MLSICRRKIGKLLLFNFVALCVAQSSFADGLQVFMSPTQINQWSKSATKDEVKRIYQELLIEYQKTHDTIDTNDITAELALINDLNFPSVAIALATKHASYFYPIQFQDEVQAHLSKSGRKIGLWNWLRGKNQLYGSIASDEVNLEEGVVACPCTKTGALVNGCCGVFGSTVGLLTGAVIGAPVGWLFYTFGFLIASGIAGPLDDSYYSAAVNLIAAGTGSGVFALIGWLTGCVVGCGSAIVLLEPEQGNFFSASVLFNDVLLMMPTEQEP